MLETYKMVGTTKEKYMRDLPVPVLLEGTQKIIEQMNNSICIIYNEERNGTDFFAKNTK